MRGTRPQALWGIRNDNNHLQLLPTQSQIDRVVAFCHNLPQHSSDFIALSLQLAAQTQLSTLIRVETAEKLKQVVKEVTEAGYCFMDLISDDRNSYKGWTSWLTIGLDKRGYLIDALTLHAHMSMVVSVMENPVIVKYCYRLLPMLYAVKRDWGAFGCNFLDFQLFEKGIGVSRGAEIGNELVSKRPPSENLLDLLQERYDLMLKYLTQMRGCLEAGPEDFRIHSYSNHYQLLLKEYQHVILSMVEEHKQYLFEKASSAQGKENMVANHEQEEWEIEEIRLTGERECRRAQMILEWREHMARIMDVPPSHLLSYQHVAKIAATRPTSVLELEALIRQDRRFCLDLYPKILEVLALQTELAEDDANQLQMRPVRKGRQGNMMTLMAQLGWSGGEEWLNRRNDDSIKLYKQIVSVTEMDGSVVQDYLQGMQGGPVGKEDINRFIKYAEYMRMGNHAKLKDCHQTWMSSAHHQEWQPEQEQDTNEQSEGQDLRPALLSTSLGSILEAQKHHDKGEGPTLASIHPSSPSLPSLHQLPLPKVEPLPDTMEAIYLKAASVKKGYSKVQKKKGKKESREEEGFVPSWDDLQRLIEA